MNRLDPLARLLDRPAPPTARCEICAAAIPDDHRHVVELGRRGVLCACHGCAILFNRSDAAARYRTVPGRVRRDRAFAMTSDAWAALGVPVGLAFCRRDSRLGQAVVCYPGPAGVVDAELEPAAWDALAAATPLAAELADDVEALLVHGTRGAAAMSCRLIPISAAYELVARLRTAWEGFTGGEAAERAIADHLRELDARAERP